MGGTPMSRINMKPSPSSRWFTAAILVILGSAYFFGIQPINQQRQALQRDILEKQHSIAELDRSAASAGEISRKTDLLRPVVALFETRFGPQAGTDKVLEALWRLADENSLEIRSV